VMSRYSCQPRPRLLLPRPPKGGEGRGEGVVRARAIFSHGRDPHPPIASQWVPPARAGAGFMLAAHGLLSLAPRKGERAGVRGSSERARSFPIAETLTLPLLRNGPLPLPPARARGFPLTSPAGSWGPRGSAARRGRGSRAGPRR